MNKLINNFQLVSSPNLSLSLEGYIHQNVWKDISSYLDYLETRFLAVSLVITNQVYRLLESLICNVQKRENISEDVYSFLKRAINIKTGKIIIREMGELNRISSHYECLVH